MDAQERGEMANRHSRAARRVASAAGPLPRRGQARERPLIEPRAGDHRVHHDGGHWRGSGAFEDPEVLVRFRRGEVIDRQLIEIAHGM